MSRKVTVPIDMSSEQKTILGLISKRQLIYLIVGGAILYAYLPVIFNLIPNIIVATIVSLISSFPVVIVVGILGFYKVSKYQLNFDFYLLLRFGQKTQIGIWRKGPKLLKKKKED
ncbi:PrgI family mobile element protein (plasmid) [Metabacillus halosaccharovorans]|uniref:PrgI family mobile element protein n=1 Tax=Metabacillus halosaccharovorans TaxID=930124 RepID=UPI000C802EEF|nr:PrgI family protein [Metabacillus halosaccharovorans]MBU7595921.1 PrgI family protein [Metabacillus halosaccharovorans]MCM3444485.1 PrgI family protein [Metabacillus halosaccharovorans]PMC36229.1 PrgI family protein [Bacillus sp. UMB0899]